MYTILIAEKRGSRAEELCSFEDKADAVITFNNVCDDYFRVMLVHNDSVLLQRINLDMDD